MRCRSGDGVGAAEHFKEDRNQVAAAALLRLAAVEPRNVPRIVHNPTAMVVDRAASADASWCIRSDPPNGRDNVRRATLALPRRQGRTL